MKDAAPTSTKAAPSVSAFTTTWITPINSIFLVTAALVDFLTPALGSQRSTVFLGLLVLGTTSFSAWWLASIKYQRFALGPTMKAVVSSVVVLGVALMLLYGRFANAHTSGNGVLADAVPSVVPMLQQKLGVISSDIRAVDTRLARMESTLAEIANPSDARIALTQRGLRYQPIEFERVIGQHDIEGIELLIKAGMDVDVADSSFPYEPIAFKLAIQRSPKSVAVLRTLLRHGFDPMKPYGDSNFSLWDKLNTHRMNLDLAVHLIQTRDALKSPVKSYAWTGRGMEQATMPALEWATRDITANHGGGCVPGEAVISGYKHDWAAMLVKAGASVSDFEARTRFYMKSLNPAQQAQCEKNIAAVASLR